MFIKPQHKKTKPKQPITAKSEQTKTVKPDTLKAGRMMRLSRDYVIEHQKLEFLSLEYVIEHGKEFGEDLWWDRWHGYFICDFSDDKEDDEEDVYYTGLSYARYGNGNLAYYEFYENGVQEGIEVNFYFSGELKSYAVWHNGKTLEVSYGWYENGMIKWYNNGKQLICFNEKGHITERKKM